ncbi:MAG: hypothetical protein ACRCY9_17355, partial [Phycicoccus sp.]
MSDGSARHTTATEPGPDLPALPADGSSGPGGAPVDEALSLLTRAQDLADQLRADAHREAT